MKTKNYRKIGGARTTKKLRKDGGGFWDFMRPKTEIMQGKNTTAYNITYKGNKLKCDVCNGEEFAHIAASISRSKTFSFIIDGDDDTAGLDQHPMTIYRCKQCNYCKMIYYVFGIEDQDRPIQEVRVNAPQPEPAQPPQEPKQK